MWDPSKLPREELEALAEKPKCLVSSNESHSTIGTGANSYEKFWLTLEKQWIMKVKVGFPS